jgi:hypothetical protein
MRARLEAIALLTLPLALAALTGLPTAKGLTDTSDPVGPVVSALGLVAWGCCGWLLLVVGLTSASLDGISRWAAPASLRVVVRLALGAGAATVLVATPALAQAPAPLPPVSATDLDWPSSSAVPSPTSSPSPTPTPSRTPSPSPSPALLPASHPAYPVLPAARVVVVRAGDCLWDLAARQLGSDATDREVATQWPRWWHANRAVIGPDPGLIHPGAVLRAPDASRPTTRGEP